MNSMDKLCSIVRELISENGCPWDREQTHKSLKKYLIEECFEAADAIDKEDYENLCEELGDVLFQVVIHSLIAEKEKKFTLDEVCEGISNKMIRRHPHVFAQADISDRQQLHKSWEDIKRQEKNYASASDSMRKIAKSLPSLMRAEKIQKKAELYNYDFGDDFKAAEEILEQLKNEESLSQEQKYFKIGEILFKLSNISRKFEINSEFALTNYSEKFINRFEDIESNLDCS